jgi:hypothetical protein
MRPSPLTGEGVGGGDYSFIFTLPSIPSRQGRGDSIGSFSLREFFSIPCKIFDLSVSITARSKKTERRRRR